MAALANKRAIVTAAAGGIGRAIVERFAREGADIAFCDIDEAAGRALSESLGGRARFSVVDCGDMAAMRTFVDTAIEELGGVDILVNNAGIAVSKSILDLTDDEFQQTIRVNLQSAFAATQIVARRMIADRNPGSIINMSSVNAVMAIPGILAYNISKGGMNQLTRNAAIALSEHGIRVNAIGPGTIQTELVRRTIFTSEEARRSVMSRTPLRRMGQPSEIASIALFLATDESSYITGEIIYADGGRMALNYTVPVAD